MRRPQLAVNCSHLSFYLISRPRIFLFLVMGRALGGGQSPGCLNLRGFKMSQQRTGKCFIYRTTTLGYIHLISSCSKSCCNTANLERALFYWHEQGRPFFSTQHTGTLLHVMSVGLAHESKQKNPCGHWCWWQRNVLHPPPPPQTARWVSCFRKHSGECSS